MEEMFERYETECEIAMMMEETTRQSKSVSRFRVGRTSYMEVASRITGDLDQEIKCCDFVTDRLVNEQVHALQRIINDLIDPRIKRKVTELLLLTQNYLKNQYDNHVRKSDQVSHNCVLLCFIFVGSNNYEIVLYT